MYICIDMQLFVKSLKVYSQRKFPIRIDCFVVHIPLRCIDTIPRNARIRYYSTDIDSVHTGKLTSVGDSFNCFSFFFLTGYKHKKHNNHQRGSCYTFINMEISSAHAVYTIRDKRLIHQSIHLRRKFCLSEFVAGRTFLLWLGNTDDKF